MGQIIKDFDLIMDTARIDHVPMMAALVRQQDEEAFFDGDGERDVIVLCESGTNDRTTVGPR